MVNISYYPVPYNELEIAMEIENAGFHPDEAGSIKTFQYRQSQAPDLFLGAYLEENVPSAAPNPLSPRELIGYVVSTISRDNVLRHESMTSHIPTSEGGTTVCIHSVCVRLDWRRKGVALGLLKQYLKNLDDGDQQLRRVLLICHDDVIELYKKAGFELVGKSDVVHGPREWFEMKYDLKRGAIATGEAPQQIPPEVFAALSKPSSKKGRKPQRISAFSSITELVSDDQSAGTQSNKYKLACPREGCGSIILLPGVGKLVESASIALDALAQNPNADSDPNFPLLPLPPPPETMEWWLITPNAMQFENIGFSRGVPDPNNPSSQTKLLSCAECDIGPLGWCLQGGTEFWVACSRVSYYSE